MLKVNIKELLEADVHLGHLAIQWCSYMAPYIYMKKDGLHIIDLYQTIRNLQIAGKAIQNIVAYRQQILFVATKKQAREIIIEFCKNYYMPYITERWICGLLTNFDEIRRSIVKLHSIVKKKTSFEYYFYTKKDRLVIDRLERKFNKNIGPISNMNILPAAVFIVDILREKNVLKEAKKINIPIFAIVDTNSDPREVDYIIPANDDSSKSIAVIFKYISKYMNYGYYKRNDNIKNKREILLEKLYV
jgi:small subunit ribosomal protein S2